MSKSVKTVIFKSPYGLYAVTNGKTRYCSNGSRFDGTRGFWVRCESVSSGAKRLCVVNNFKEKPRA